MCLEVAFCIINIYDRYLGMSKENVLSMNRLSNPWATDEMFKEIYDDLLIEV
jgi:hypothetical protein